MHTAKEIYSENEIQLNYGVETNHLGNVLVTVSAKPILNDSSGVVNFRTPDVMSVSDYEPFGSTMQGRSWTAQGLDGYRFGFNGKEKDSEGMGGGGSTYDYGFRIYNPQIGRFLSIDPITKKYPWYTPYQFAGNKPIMAVDLDGLEESVVIYQDRGEGNTLIKSCKYSSLYPGQKYGPLGKTGTATVLLNSFANDKDLINSAKVQYSYLDAKNNLVIQNRGTFDVYKDKEDNWLVKFDDNLDGGRPPLLARFISDLNPIVSVANFVKINLVDGENIYNEKASKTDKALNFLDVATFGMSELGTSAVKAIGVINNVVIQISSDVKVTTDYYKKDTDTNSDTKSDIKTDTNNKEEIKKQ